MYRHHFDSDESDYSERLGSTFKIIADHEEALASILLNYLNAVPEIKIIGSSSANSPLRVPTISFIHENMKSDNIVEKVDKHGIGIRFGDFYAKKLIQNLGLEDNNGVVRVSLVHYNTKEEVEKLITVFRTIF